MTRRNFYPRPPRGGRHLRRQAVHSLFHISIHALREEGDNGSEFADYIGIISIHALREEGDTPSYTRWRPWRISIHALREEGDAVYRAAVSARELFLSTPSARRATRTGQVFAVKPFDFYPRPPRGGRPIEALAAKLEEKISIHALREEGDSKNRDKISIFL